MKLRVNAKLDSGFTPLSLVCREMRENTKKDGQDIVVAIERNKGYISTYKTRIYKDNTGHDSENFTFIERIVKSLLWVATAYLLKNGKYRFGSLITALPAMFMTAVSTTYILIAEEGLRLNSTVSYIIGAVAAAVTLCIYLIFLNKKSDLKLKTKA